MDLRIFKADIALQSELTVRLSVLGHGYVVYLYASRQLSYMPITPPPPPPHVYFLFFYKKSVHLTGVKLQLH